jgi:hypothetical protein
MNLFHMLIKIKNYWIEKSKKVFRILVKKQKDH